MWTERWFTVSAMCRSLGSSLCYSTLKTFIMFRNKKILPSGSFSKPSDLRFFSPPEDVKGTTMRGRTLGESTSK